MYLESCIDTEAKVGLDLPSQPPDEEITSVCFLCLHTRGVDVSAVITVSADSDSYVVAGWLDQTSLSQKYLAVSWQC